MYHFLKYLTLCVSLFVTISLVIRVISAAAKQQGTITWIDMLAPSVMWTVFVATCA